MNIKFKSYNLDNLCKLQIGKTPKRGKTDYWDKGFPWVSIADMKGKLIEATKEQITTKAIEECGCKIIQKGTLLLSFKLSIGKLAFAGTDLFTNEAIVALLIRDYKRVYPEYLYYILKSIPLTGSNKAAKGATLNTASLKKIQIPIPENFNDQIRIAKILEKVEALIIEREASIYQIENYLNNIYYNMFGDPVRDYKGLKKVELRELGIWKSGGTPPRKNRDYYAGNLPWLTSGELNEIYVSDSKEKISKEAVENCNASEIEVGSLLLGMYDTAALKSSITRLKCYCNQAIAFSKLNDNLCNTIFVYYTIQLGRDFFRRQQRGVRQKNLNLSMIKSIKVPFPQRKLQNKFAAIVKRGIQQNKHYVNSLKELKNFFESISQKLFNGGINLDKINVSDESEAYVEFSNSRMREREADETRLESKQKPRITKIDNLTFKNYYEKDFALMIKTHFRDFDFKFQQIEEMFAEEEGGEITYLTTQELKKMKGKAPSDIQTFIFDCIEKKDKNLQLKQKYYDALSDLNLKKIKLKSGNDTILRQINSNEISREDLSGIYFQIIK